MKSNKKSLVVKSNVKAGVAGGNHNRSCL